MERKDQICNIVKRYYNDSIKESLEVLESKYLNMYLNTNLSIEEIDKKISKELKSNVKGKSKDYSFLLYIFALLVLCIVIISVFALIKSVMK